MSASAEKPGIGVESRFGEMQVVVFLPGPYSQHAWSFKPDSRADGLRDVPRRDLAIIRAMLQDALDDVDDERRRRIAETAPTGAVLPPYGMSPGNYVR